DAQHEDRALLARQRRERLVEDLARLALERAGQGIARDRGLLEVSVGKLLLARTRRADVVHGQVRRDPAQPGAEGPLEIAAVERLPGPDERFLSHVVRHVVSPHDPERGRVRATLVAADDLLEREQVSARGLAQELSLDGIGLARQMLRDAPRGVYDEGVPGI